MSRGAGGAVTIPGTCGQRHSWGERCRWIQRPYARTWTSMRVDASGAGNGRNASPQTAQYVSAVLRSRTATTTGSVVQSTIRNEMEHLCKKILDSQAAQMSSRTHSCYDLVYTLRYKVVKISCTNRELMPKVSMQGRKGAGWRKSESI